MAVIVALGGAAGAVRAATTDLDASFDVSGSVADIFHNTSAAGFQFQVRFHDIKYAGRVDRTLVERTDAEHVTVWLSLQNVKLTIQQTDISGSRHSANCGPLDINLATREEVWLAIDLERRVVDGKQDLAIVNRRFRLTSGNWSVGAPSWVRSSGFGMSESRVVSSLQSGLQNSPETIEEQLKDQAPYLLAQVETRVTALLVDGRVALK